MQQHVRQIKDMNRYVDKLREPNRPTANDDLTCSPISSRNQLSYIPPSICQLQGLQGLILNNNRLVSLPEEIGRMASLKELDASCNEITHLPVQIGDLAALKSLNLRRNHLQEVPVGE